MVLVPGERLDGRREPPFLLGGGLWAQELRADALMLSSVQTFHSTGSFQVLPVC